MSNVIEKTVIDGHEFCPDCVEYARKVEHVRRLHWEVPDVGGCRNGCRMATIKLNPVGGNFTLECGLPVYVQTTPWGDVVGWIQRH